MKRLLTASRLEQAEKCPASQVIPPVVDLNPAEPRDRGVALHKYLQDVATIGAVPALQQVPEAFRAEAAVIDLESLPHSSPEAWAVEVAYAYNVTTDTGRELHRKGDRDYSDVDPEHEVAGTADIIGVTLDSVVCLDVKTGRKWLEDPFDALQVLLLLLAACRTYGKSQGIVGWIRLVDGVPKYAQATIDMLDLDTRVRERIEQVALRWRAAVKAYQAAPESVEAVLGPWCRYCDAFSRCPAQASLAREVTRAALGESTLPLEVPKERRADFWRWVKAIGVLHEKLVAHLEDLARREPIELEDGKVYGLKQDFREYLNATIAREVLREVSPELAAVVVSEEVSLKASKDSLLKGVRAHLPRGETQKGYMTKLLKMLRDRGGTYVVETPAVKVYKRPRAEEKPLPSGEAEPDVPM